MFSFALVAFTGYILSIFICTMLKAGKLRSIASIAILANLFKNLTYTEAFCSTLQKFH